MPQQQETIRLRNLRGVFTHCILLDKQISDVEVVVYRDVSSSLPSPSPSPSPSQSQSQSQSQQGQEAETMVLKLNSTPIPSGEPILGRRNGNEQQTQTAMKWKVIVPLTKVENKIEINTGKTEDQGSMIYLTRQ